MPIPFYMTSGEIEDPIDTLKGHLHAAKSELGQAVKLAMEVRERSVPASDGKQLLTDLITTLEAHQRVLSDFEDDLTEGQRTRRG